MGVPCVPGGVWGCAVCARVVLVVAVHGSEVWSTLYSCSICQELALEEEEEEDEDGCSVPPAPQDPSSALRKALRVGEEAQSPG